MVTMPISLQRLVVIGLSLLSLLGMVGCQQTSGAEIPICPDGQIVVSTGSTYDCAALPDAGATGPAGPAGDAGPPGATGDARSPDSDAQAPLTWNVISSAQVAEPANGYIVDGDAGVTLTLARARKSSAKHLAWSRVRRLWAEPRRRLEWCRDSRHRRRLDVDERRRDLDRPDDVGQSAEYRLYPDSVQRFGTELRRVPQSR